MEITSWGGEQRETKPGRESLGGEDSVLLSPVIGITEETLEIIWCDPMRAQKRCSMVDLGKCKFLLYCYYIRSLRAQESTG